MDLSGFLFDEWAFYDGGSLAAGEDFAAGYVEGWGVAADEAVQAFCREGVDDAADSGPIDGSGAHGAGFGAGVEGAFGKLCGAELPADLGAGKTLGVLGWSPWGGTALLRAVTRTWPFSSTMSEPKGCAPCALAERANSIA